MAKNDYRTNINQYVNQEEAIRKAKGNPNKNIHHKKKNSNYGGYAAAAAEAQKPANTSRRREQVKLPTWLNVCLGILFAAIIVVLVLRMTVYKDSDLLGCLSSLLLGVTCLALFYTRRYRTAKKETLLYKAVTVILTICGAVYTLLGAVGLLTVLGIM